MGKKINEKSEIVVIGAGLGGLSVAALLAKRGRRVLVLEKAGIIGGRAHCIEKEGFMLDYGIHMNRFCQDGKCAEVMRAVGGSPDFRNTDEPKVYRGGRFDHYPSGVQGLMKTGMLSPKSKLKVVPFLLKMLVTKPGKIEDKTVEEVLAEFSPDADLSSMMSFFCGTTIIAPDTSTTSAGEAAAFLQSAIKSIKHPVGYLRGGWQSYFRLMRETIEKNGEIRTGVKVTDVAIRNNRVTHVVADGKIIETDAVVCTVPFMHVPQIIKDLPPELDEYAENLEPTSGVCIDFALSKRVSSTKSVIFTEDPISMGCLVSNLDSSVAPAGKQLGTWFSMFPYSKAKDKEFAAERLKWMRDEIGRIFPGVWDVCEWVREYTVPIVDGVLPRVGQAKGDRAPLVCPGIANLFFAGDTTCGGGSGGDIALDSALRCAPLVDRFLP